MTTSAIEQTVLHLPKQDRAHLAHLLLESVDEPTGTEMEKLWLDEAQCRSVEIDQSQVELIKGDVFEAQVQAMFK